MASPYLVAHAYRDAYEKCRMAGDRLPSARACRSWLRHGNSFGSGGDGGKMAVCLKITEEDVPLVTSALEHYDAYLVATQCEDGRYQALAERLQRKRPGKEEPERSVKKKR